MGTAYIVKSRGTWMDQAQCAVDAFEKSGAKTLREFAGVNHHQFALFIEAMVALKQPVDEEMMALARLRSVNELLGLPEEEQ